MRDEGGPGGRGHVGAYGSLVEKGGCAVRGGRERDPGRGRARVRGEEGVNARNGSPLRKDESGRRWEVKAMRLEAALPWFESRCLAEDWGVRGCSRIPQNSPVWTEQSLGVRLCCQAALQTCCYRAPSLWR